mgnify:CR=1 FL=1
MERKSARASLTQGNLRMQIIHLAIPMVLGMLGLTVFNIVDTFYVGMLGTKALAALSFTFPVVLVLNSIALGMGVGASSVISRAMGAGDHHRVVRLTTDSLSLSFLFIVLFVILGELTIDPLFRLLGAKGEVLTLVKSYMRIWYAGLPFVVFPMVGNNAIRALGDTKTPGIIMMIAGLVNMAVDPLLIFGVGPFPRWGVAGAAVATVFARSITFSVALYVLVRRERIVSFKRVPMAEVLTSWREILFVGGPAAVTRVIFPVAVGVITSFLAVLGPHAVAGFGVATKVEGFALLFTFALGAVMAPFAGQNYGAGNISRVRNGLAFASALSMGIGLLLLAILFLFARPLASLFSKDPEVIRVAVLYFHVAPLGYGLLGVFIIASTILNALRRPLEAAALSFIQMFVLYIPLAYVGRILWGTPGIFVGITIAAAAMGIPSYFIVLRILRPKSP